MVYAGAESRTAFDFQDAGFIRTKVGQAGFPCNTHAGEVMFARELHTGKIGEHICALRMLKAGISASIVNLETVDVIAWDRNKVWRVQVKSGHIRYEKDRQAGYQFNIAVGGKQKRPLTYEDCDIVALVAIEHEQVWFYPVDTLGRAKSKRVKTSKFDDPHLCLKTWERALDHYQ